MTHDELTRLKEAATKADQTAGDANDCLPVEYHEFSQRAVAASYAFRDAATPELILSLITRLEMEEEALKPFDSPLGTMKHPTQLISRKLDDFAPVELTLTRGQLKLLFAAAKSLKTTPAT